MFRQFLNNEIILSAAKSLALLVCFTFVSSCGEKAPTEGYSYNAYFVTPSPEKKRIYVGTVTGLSSCKYIVSDYYNKRRKFIKGDWDYVCCWRVEEDNCVEEHRYDK